MAAISSGTALLDRFREPVIARTDNTCYQVNGLQQVRGRHLMAMIAARAPFSDRS
jgi:hypothetical protein